MVDELTQFTGDESQIKQSNGLISQSVDFSDQFDVHGSKNFKYVDEEQGPSSNDIQAKLSELGFEYKKTEYNCHKKHHNNPITINKLNSLLRGAEI